MPDQKWGELTQLSLHEFRCTLGSDTDSPTDSDDEFANPRAIAPGILHRKNHHPTITTRLRKLASTNIRPVCTPNLQNSAPFLLSADPTKTTKTARNPRISHAPSKYKVATTTSFGAFITNIHPPTQYAPQTRTRLELPCALPAKTPAMNGKQGHQQMIDNP